MDNLPNNSSQATEGSDPISSVSREDAGRFGRYRLGREIGRGFSSIVYEAEDTQRGRVVALKVLTFLQNLSPERREDLAERFAREARAISSLSHPSIVAIYEVGQTDDGLQYMAMERLEGETLRHRLQWDGTLPPEEAVPLALQLADALQYAHERGVIHRDVKPDNIFVLPDGRAKLMDFGVAHVLDDDALTQTGTIVGSPAYMSPEQINGQPLDSRSDVFSLGVTLAEMVVGHKPFEAPTIPAVMNQILRRPPQMEAIYPRSLRRVIEKALAKNRAGRFQSAAALAGALRQQVLPALPQWEPTSTLIVPQAPLASEAHAPQFDGEAWGFDSRRRRRVPASVWALAALGIAALSAWPILTHQGGATVSARTAHAPIGQVHQIPIAWHRVSQSPASSGRPRRPDRTPAPHRLIASAPREGVQIVEGSLGPAALLRPSPRPQPLAPSAPATPAVPATPIAGGRPRAAIRTAHAPRPGSKPRSGPQLAMAPTGAPTPPPFAADIQPPIVKVGGYRQEQQDLTMDGTTDPPPPAVPAPEEGPDRTPAAPRATDIPDAPPHLAHRIPPIYPEGARARGIEGVVTLRVSVDEDGSVVRVEVAQSSGVASLDRAAIRAVRQWEFDPAFRDGEAVSGVILERVAFKLN